MTRKGRTVSSRSRVASSQDLQRALKRSAQEVEPKRARLASAKAAGLPETPVFLGELPLEGEVYEPQQPATKKLAEIIDANYYATNFEEAITYVSEQKILELDQIKTLNQFYFYVDALVTWVPEIRHWDWDGETIHERTVYLRLIQFYYYFNQPQLEALQSPIAPVTGADLSPISEWMHDFALEWGAFLDTPASNAALGSFKFAPEYDWQDYEKDPEDYATFNKHFARTFKDIDVRRPVADADKDRVIVFPVESTFVGQWTISTRVGDPLPAPPSIVVKHIEWPISELLQDSKFGDVFAGGIFCHTFLNTYDYHRQHTPVAGKVVEAKFIPGQVYLDVELKDQEDPGEGDPNSDVARTVIPRRYLDADDPTGYQFVQCRGLLVLETKNMGKVAILPMGMAQVSSVVFVTPEEKLIVLTPEEKKKWDYEKQVEVLNERIHKELVGKEFSKGQMFSTFQFGGSDCVIVFERKANVDITAKVGVHYPIRSQLAVSNHNR